MQNKVTLVFLVLLQLFLAGYSQRRIIDMHIHSYEDDAFARPLKDPWGTLGAPNADVHYKETKGAFREFNIVKAMVSGSPASVENWVKQDSNHLMIRGIALDNPSDYGMDTVRFEKMVKEKVIEVFGEIGAYYDGTTLNDPIWQPYLRICEKYDIPVAVHAGGGPPQSTYTWAPKARLSLTDPFLIEDVLIKYPRLRIYMMHSGEVWYEHAVRLMAFYPQLYSDLGAILWVTPYTQRYAIEFLKQAKEAGVLDRVMFGSDQMRWPYAIGKSIRFLDNIKFLTKQDKDNILYNNAARFLRMQK